MKKVVFDEKERLFHLKNDQMSYVVGVLMNKHLGHFYFGESLNEPLKQSYFRTDQNKGLTANVFEGNSSFSLNNERLEYPCYGTTDFRQSAFDILGENGSTLSDFKYKTHRILSEKTPLTGMPCSHGDAVVLEIELYDDVMDLELTLLYAVFNHAIVRRTRLKNDGDASVYIDKLMSGSIDLPDNHWEMMQFSGDWARERAIYTSPLRPGIQSIYSNRGASSANHNPSLILKRKETTEFHGEAIGVSLIYSGNFLAQVEVDSNDISRLMMGISPDYFKWKLCPGKCFDSPEVVMTYTSTGLEQLSKNFHRFIRKHIIQDKWQNRVRPILLNNWEATYFDFDEDKIVALAKEGAKLGVELFVLDDGWFGNRDSDQTGLGDWFVNTQKLPNGIKGLSEKIHDLGMQFGLWIEPEMVNNQTKLMKEHPDFLMGDPSRKISHGRNQYVLDFSRDDVVQHIFDQLTLVLDGSHVDYIKWDMNKNITEAYSRQLPDDQQGEVFHRYILGVYKLYDMLTTRYPNILIESCASGGGRFDLGMMYYAPQAWTSDNTDAIERLKIQHGTSMIYPLVTMGSHVSAIPNHQVARMTSLKTRGDVAYFGTFGYELDVTQMSSAEKNEMTEQIKYFKNMRRLIHTGDFYRLLSPFETNETAWQVVDEEKEEAFVAWFKVLAKPNEAIKYLKIRGLDEHDLYYVTGYDEPISGSVLMNHGIMIRPSFNGVEKTKAPIGDFQSRVWYLKKANNSQ